MSLSAAAATRHAATAADAMRNRAAPRLLERPRDVVVAVRDVRHVVDDRTPAARLRRDAAAVDAARRGVGAARARRHTADQDEADLSATRAHARSSRGMHRASACCMLRATDEARLTRVVTALARFGQRSRGCGPGQRLRRPDGKTSTGHERAGGRAALLPHGAQVGGARSRARCRRRGRGATRSPRRPTLSSR
jgi:hypothetical protein